MKQILPFCLLTSVFLTSCSQQPISLEEATPPEPSPFSTAGRIISTYTTAMDTDLRMTPTGTHELGPGEQPPETELAIFVNPDKRFQTFFGIGGAITDASAEVFAKLPSEKQDEF